MDILRANGEEEEIGRIGCGGIGWFWLIYTDEDADWRLD